MFMLPEFLSFKTIVLFWMKSCIAIQGQKTLISVPSKRLHLMIWISPFDSSILRVTLDQFISLKILPLDQVTAKSLIISFIYLILKAKSFYLYSVYNNAYDAVLVGVLNETSIQINTSAIHFVNDEIPISEIVPENIDLSYAVACVFFALGIVELIVCLFILCFYIVYRNNSLIRRSSFPISVAILFGIILASIGQLLYCLGSTDALCVITLYFIRIGLIIIISGMFIKNYRIYRIFANRTAAAVNLSEAKLLSIIIIIALVYIVVITIIVIVIGFDAVLRYGSDNIYYQYIQCRVPNDTWNSIFNITMAVSSMIIIILLMIFAWLTRNVQSEFRETEALGAFAIIVAATFIILVTLIYSLSDGTDSQLFRFILLEELLSIISVSAIVLLFVPKIYIIIKQGRKNRHKKNGWGIR